MDELYEHYLSVVWLISPIVNFLWHLITYSTLDHFLQLRMLHTIEYVRLTTNLIIIYILPSWCFIWSHDDLFDHVLLFFPYLWACVVVHLIMYLTPVYFSIHVYYYNVRLIWIKVYIYRHDDLFDHIIMTFFFFLSRIVIFR